MKEKHLILGALTVPRTNYEMLKSDFNALKVKLGFRPEGEIKWGKVSAAYFERYEALSAWFFDHLNANNFTFRAHV